jgi:hypothetical protein
MYSLSSENTQLPFTVGKRYIHMYSYYLGLPGSMRCGLRGDIVCRPISFPLHQQFFHAGDYVVGIHDVSMSPKYKPNKIINPPNKIGTSHLYGYGSDGDIFIMPETIIARPIINGIIITKRVIIIASYCIASWIIRS